MRMVGTRLSGAVIALAQYHDELLLYHLAAFLHEFWNADLGRDFYCLQKSSIISTYRFWRFLLSIVTTVTPDPYGAHLPYS